MKIAFLYDSINPYNKGGSEKRLSDITTRLSREKHDVHIYTMNWWNGEKIKKKDGATLHGISKYYPLYKGKVRSIKQGLMFGFASFKLLKEDFDILDANHMVYFHLFPAWLLCKIKSKPLVVTWHEVWGKDYWMSYLGKKGLIGSWIEKIAVKIPDKIVSVSNLTTSRLINELNVPKDKIITVPNGIDIDSISKVRSSKEKSDIIFAGRLLSHKNVHMLIESVQLIQKSRKDIKCIIVGNGPELKNLKKLTKSLKLEKNISFKGFLDKHNEVLSLMKSSKVFVLPSTREGFGIIVSEANACGIPVITINHKDNASKDLIQEGKNGYIADLSAESISKSVEKVLTSTKSMQAECLDSATQYDLPRVMEQLKKVYGI